MASSRSPVCNACAGQSLQRLIDFGRQPVTKHHQADPDLPAAAYQIDLYLCPACGLSQLVHDIPGELFYENYITLSNWKYQPHVAHEVELIRALEGMRPDTPILEIGSNDGLFLAALRDAGFTDLQGVEPAADAHAYALSRGLCSTHAYLTPELAADLKTRRGSFGAIVSRQNLEHIADLATVRAAVDLLLADGGYFVVEVPDFASMIESLDFALWEEHVNHFTPGTLAAFLSSCGCRTVHQERILFSGTSLLMIGRKSATSATSAASTITLPPAADIDASLAYGRRWPAFRQQVGEFAAALAASGRKMAIYGAGARGCCFINYTGIAHRLACVLDDQPGKQGAFLPGSRLPIVPGERLYDGIDVCLLAVNTENEAKVLDRHRQWTAGGGRFLSILPPSDLLPDFWKAAIADAS